MAGWRDVGAVAVGGVIGTGIRLMLDTVIPHTDAGFPWDTLIINVTGSFVLAMLAGFVWERTSTPTWLKAGLGTGIVGSFTTFSAIVVSLVAETVGGEWMLALAYLAASLILGFGAAALGLNVAGRVSAVPE